MLLRLDHPTRSPLGEAGAQSELVENLKMVKSVANPPLLTGRPGPKAINGELAGAPTDSKCSLPPLPRRPNHIIRKELLENITGEKLFKIKTQNAIILRNKSESRSCSQRNVRRVRIRGPIPDF